MKDRKRKNAVEIEVTREENPPNSQESRRRVLRRRLRELERQRAGIEARICVIKRLIER
ncbi:MAG TPA: hypothetical protein VFV58_12620 [Blastocatellia bacterium]|jgi:hypothetical protein|nr:hypothetical protein [Blastocatellia bacterium]